MGHLLPTALAAWALAFPFPRPAAPPAAPVISPAEAAAAVARARQFAAAQDAWTAVCGGAAYELAHRRLYPDYLVLFKAGHFAEARDMAGAFLAMCTRAFGKDHYDTRSARLLHKSLGHTAALPEAKRAEFLTTNRMWDDYLAAREQGNFAEAAKVFGRILEIRRGLLPREDLAVDINSYAYVLHEAGRYADADPLYREALEICRQICGGDHPATAAVCGNLAINLSAQDRHAEARPLYDEAIEMYTRLYGEDHPSTALALNNLGTRLDKLGKHAQAEPALRRCLDILSRVEGKDSYRAVIARANLAYNLDHLGKYEAAEELYRQVLETRQNPPDEKALSLAASSLALVRQRVQRLSHPEIARIYNNLAVNLDNQGRHADAEWYHRQALAMYQTFDEDYVLAGRTASNLAVNLNKQGRYVEAEEFYGKALRILLRATKGKVDESVAKVYGNRGGNLVALGKAGDAQKLQEQALAKFRELWGNGHEIVAIGCNGLARTLTDQGKFVEAEPLLREALAIQEATLGKEHPHAASARINLAINLQQQGRYDEARGMLEAGLELHRRLLGEGHPETAWAYKHLIINAWGRGDYAGAEALGPRAAASFEAARRRVSFAGLGRVGTADELSPLNRLAAVAARNKHFAAAWDYLERGLARGLFDDLAPRAVSVEERAAEQGLLLELDRLDERLQVLLAGPEVSAEAQKKADEVRRERDATQVRLVKLRADLATRLGVAAGQVYDLDRVQKALRPGEALLAWVDIAPDPKAVDPNGEHWACLVKGTGDPVWVPLRRTDPAGAGTDADDQFAARVRAAVADRHPTEDWKDLAGKLTDQRLGPLKDHLDGLRHLIVLPSAHMAGVPVEVLTDLTVSYAPSGTMLAWLREKRAVAGTKAPARHLLALGDPAFKTGPDEPVPLPGTRQELAGIARVFDESTQLMGPKASEQTLDHVAAEDGGLRRFGYLHFATHGVLDARRPMSSALLLAQDQLPDPLKQVRDGKEAYDGRLTADRILRRWNGQLDADLVTLSACKTGLGKLSGGEGYLGFSQALFLAGARSLVLSLWEVDDTATSLLMTRFYENLMGLSDKLPGGPVKPLPKAEALAEAKQWLQRLTPDQVKQLSDGLPRQGTRGDPRGRVVKKAAAEKAALSYDHPYYWSGFILVGDPR